MTITPGDLPNHNSHDKNHLIVKAIKTLTSDHIQNQQTKSRPEYSFEDWEYIFYLLGVLDPTNGTDPIPHPEDIGGIETRRSGFGEWQDGSNGGQVLDWLHGKNPLNVSDTLTEWMLLTLVEKLEAELAELRRNHGNTHLE